MRNYDALMQNDRLILDRELFVFNSKLRFLPSSYCKYTSRHSKYERHCT